MERGSLEYYLGKSYPFHAVAEPEGGWTVVFPDLPGCLTVADTMEELATMADEARRFWIETEYEAGRDIPEPSYPPDYSGKFNLRLSKSLHRSLAEAASNEGLSLNTFVTALLERAFSQSVFDSRTSDRLSRVELQISALHQALQSNQPLADPSHPPGILQSEVR